MLILNSKDDVSAARKGDVSSSIRLIKILRDHISGEKQPLFDNNARKYFVECFDSFLSAVEQAKSSREVADNIATCLNLKSSRGRQKNSAEAYYAEAVEIFNIQKERGVSVEKAIEILKTDPAYKKMKIRIDARALRNAYKKHLPWLETLEKLKNIDKSVITDLKNHLSKIESK
jgi:hypothetical protein